MIPVRQFDPEFLSMLKQYIDKTPISLTELMAAIIVAMLEHRDGNRTHVAKELKVPLRTLRYKIKVIEALGFEVPMPKRGVPRKRRAS
jgi:DNA-binding NtrC family response regulator